MSTPRYKKQARQQEHAKQKENRKYEKLLASVKANKKEFVEYKPPQPYQRETPDIPSVSNVIPTGVCARPEKKEYTGTLVKGISTLHKSNAVPIINKEEAIEHAHMRR